MTETLANGYSFESTQRELSNEYQHDRVQMVFIDICVLVLWTKVALALEELKALFFVLKVMCCSCVTKWNSGNSRLYHFRNSYVLKVR